MRILAKLLTIVYGSAAGAIVGLILGAGARSAPHEMGCLGAPTATPPVVLCAFAGTAVAGAWVLTRSFRSRMHTSR